SCTGSRSFFFSRSADRRSLHSFPTRRAADLMRVYDRGSVSIASDEQLVRELDRARTLDVDFFATNVRLPDRYQRQITDFAHRIGKPVLSQELYPASEYGVDGAVHLRTRRAYA